MGSSVSFVKRTVDSSFSAYAPAPDSDSDGFDDKFYNLSNALAALDQSPFADVPEEILGEIARNLETLRDLCTSLLTPSNPISSTYDFSFYTILTF